MTEFCCKELETHIRSEVAIIYIPKFREYGILMSYSEDTLQQITYCPWCGNKLPTDLRDDWFDIVFDELGIEDTDSPDIPKDMQSDKWWRSKLDL